MRRFGRSRYPLTEVFWLDSAQLDRGDWMEVPQVQEMVDDLEQRSVGFVVAETEIALALARSISEWREDMVEKVEGVLVIPKAAITGRKDA